MTQKSPTIVFFGTEDFSLASLKALVAHNYPIAAVVTKPDTPRGRGHKLTPPAVKVFAEQHNLTVWQPKKLTEITAAIEALPTPRLGVLVSYGKIIPQSIIDMFSMGIVNVHPSLLPLYRGPTPIESAIINGDTTTGVTIMQLSARMDAGLLYHQVQYPLNGNETQASLYPTLAQLGAEQLASVLPDIISGALRPSPQDDACATYCQLLTKDMSDCTSYMSSAVTLERKIRAHSVFPRTKYTYGDISLTIITAHTAPQRATPLDIQCKDGTYVIVDTVMTPHGKTMSAEAFLRGYKPSPS